MAELRDVRDTELLELLLSKLPVPAALSALMAEHQLSLFAAVAPLCCSYGCVGTYDISIWASLKYMTMPMENREQPPPPPI
jgi:hypothetical protein